MGSNDVGRNNDDGCFDADRNDGGAGMTSAGAAEAEIPGSTPAAVADRRCGRCQRPFPGDPALNFQTDWALCPECATILMPRPEVNPS